VAKKLDRTFDVAPEQYLELGSVFKEASRNIPFIFLCKKAAKKLKIRLHIK
jgi:hypothetical protein